MFNTLLDKMKEVPLNSSDKIGENKIDELVDFNEPEEDNFDADDENPASRKEIVKELIILIGDDFSSGRFAESVAEFLANEGLSLDEKGEKIINDIGKKVVQFIKKLQ